MAISEDKNGTDANGLNLPQSTGAVEYQPPEDPPGIDPADAGKSTGAVEYTGPAGGKKVSNPNVQDGSEVRVEYDDKPVTMTTGWLSDSQAKVVTREHQKAAAESVKESPNRSAVAQTPEDSQKAEKKAAEEPDDPAAVERPGGDDLPAGEPSGPNKDEAPAEETTDDDGPPAGEPPSPEPEQPAEQPAAGADAGEQATAGTEQPEHPDKPARKPHGGRRAAAKNGDDETAKDK